MLVLNEQIETAQIEKARQRAQGLDLRALADTRQDQTPGDIASRQAREGRLGILVQTLGDRDRAETTFERLIDGNELQPVNYLEHGAIVAKSVCRLTLIDPTGRSAGYATGFLAAPGILLTNNHVFPARATAERSYAEFDLELDVFDRPKTATAFALRPDRLFYTSLALDFSVVAVESISRTGVPLSAYG